MKRFAAMPSSEMLVFVFSLLLFNVVAGSAQTGTVDEFNPKRVIKKPFPAIINPKTVPAGQAKGEIRAKELVIGVSIDGESRAYPINMLCRPSREIVTDTVGGKRIAVTWCHLCHNGIIFFAEKEDGKPITLAVSGMLWKGNLVMRDEETGSLWSHMLGRCMEGNLKGETLDSLPCEITTWEDWVKRHPETTSLLLKRTMERYEKEFYDDLKKYVLIYSELGRGRSWKLSELEKQPLVNDFFGKKALLVVYDRESTSARIYSRRLEDFSGPGVLTFEPAGKGQFKDRETGSLWDRDTAEALSGALKGKSLTPLVGTLANDWSWRKFYPKGGRWRPATSQKP